MARTIYQIASEYADNHELSLDDEQQVCFEACTHGANAVLEEIEKCLNEISLYPDVYDYVEVCDAIRKKIKELKG